MDQLEQFRVMLLLLSAAYMGPRFYFRWQARRVRELPEEPHDLQRESQWRLVVLGVSGLGANLIAILWLCNPDWVDFAALPLPPWSRWVGLGLGIGAVILSYLGHRTLSVNFTSVLQTRFGHELVMEGIYRHIRHPIYASFYALFACSFFITQNGLIGFLALIYCLVIYNRVLVEEVMLLHAFGNRYHDYMQQTGRFLPRRLFKWEDS